MTAKNKRAADAISRTNGNPTPYLPARQISFTRDLQAVMLKTWPGNTPLPRPKPLLTKEEIEGWLLEEGLIVNEATLSKLLDSLNLMRSTVHLDQAVSYDPVERVMSALPCLKEDLEFLRRIGLAESQRAVRVASRVRLDKHAGRNAAIEKLVSAIDALNEYLVPAITGKRGGASWHYDAMLLVFVLRGTTVRANGKAISFTSSKGPGMRFLQKALLEAAGVNPTPDAIKHTVLAYQRLAVPQRPCTSA